MGEEATKETKATAKLTLSGLQAWMSSTDKRVLENADMMKFVVLVLLAILGTSVITTGLWVIDAFFSKNKPQVLYITTSDDEKNRQISIPQSSQQSYSANRVKR